MGRPVSRSGTFATRQTADWRAVCGRSARTVRTVDKECGRPAGACGGETPLLLDLVDKECGRPARACRGETPLLLGRLPRRA